jgi:hypothetical protein
MTVTSATSDIAYILASGLGGDCVEFDHLSYGAPAALYDVYLDTGNPPTTLICQDLTVPLCTPDVAVIQSSTTYYWQIKSHNACGNFLGPVWSFSTNLPPDFDGDGDVDMTDFSHLQLCLSGSGPQPDPLCQDTKLDADTDVDAADVALFLKCLNGSNVPPPAGCAD